MEKKTLVIHPKDNSTDFLKPIYQDIPDVTVINGNCSKNWLRDLIKDFDRVIMMGHGCPSGLFDVGQFTVTNGLIIDRTFVEVLQTKECICIWCNADGFVKPNGLKGFYSGMFISEVEEADYFGYDVTQKTVTESNEKFAQLVSENINNDIEKIYLEVKEKYTTFATNNIVADYNTQRLYYI